MRTDAAPVEHLRLRGLVLQSLEQRGANRSLRLLTAEAGVIRAEAYGAGRAVSELAAASRLFCYGEYQLHARRGYYRVESARVLEPFFELSRAVEHYAAASYFAELLMDTAPVGQGDAQALRLALCALAALTRQGRSHRLVKAAFELRLMADAGYAPDLSGCAVCGAQEPAPAVFDPREAALRCASCGEGLPLTPGALAALRHIAAAELPKLFAFSLGEESLQNLCAVCERFAAAQTERDYPSLTLYKQFTQENQAGFSAGEYPAGPPPAGVQ